MDMIFSKRATQIEEGIFSILNTKKEELLQAGREVYNFSVGTPDFKTPEHIMKAMEESSNTRIQELRVDGGPTNNQYLMQFQSDILGIPVRIPDFEELSGIGAAYVAGLAVGLYDASIFEKMGRKTYDPFMNQAVRQSLYGGWKEAVNMICKVPSGKRFF